MNQIRMLKIDLRQMILAVETAVSLVGMNDTNHGKRVGYIASQLAHALGFSEADIQFSFELGMLHDCGVSTEQMHSNLVNHFDWDDAYIHCEIGHRLLKDFAPLAKYAEPILYHHTSWKELKTKNISDYDARMANLIFLADRIDVLGAAHYETDILLFQQEITQSISACQNTYFDPEIVAAFLKIESSEAFWIALSGRHIIRYTWDMGLISSDEYLTLAQLKQMSLMMAYIVDQKSPFTAEHSVRVADVAKHIAVKADLPEYQRDEIEIASLLHDIGKLHTPDAILDKPAPLDKSERAIMNQHSYETYEILRQISGLGEVAKWAAFHHEGINGGGYPFHLGEKDLSIEARIIAVADVFQALIQERPYRKGVERQDALAILNTQVQARKLDSDIVSLVEKNSIEFFNIAKGIDPNFNQPSIDLFIK